MNDKTVAYRCIACSSFFSHAPPPLSPLPLLLLLHLPHAIGGSLLSPHTVEESDCHTGLWYLQGPSVVAGQPGFHAASREHQARAGRPTGRLDDFGFMLAVTKLPGDWIRVNASSRFEQISAVIFVCPRGATADGFHSFSSYHIAHDWM